MTTRTVRAKPGAREVAQYPRPHASIGATALVGHGVVKTIPGAQRRIERAFAVVNQLAELAQDNAQLREWLRGRLTTSGSALRLTEVDGTSDQVLAILSKADARENLAREEFRASPTPESKSRWLAAASLEVARQQDAIAVIGR